MKTNIFKCFIFILNRLFSCSKHCFCYNFVNIVFLVVITTPVIILLLHSSTPPTSPPSPSFPLIKGSRDSAFSKLMAIGDLKNLGKKRGLVSLEMEGCHIISRFFWRFFTMLHRKKSWCVHLSFFQQTCAAK